MSSPTFHSIKIKDIQKETHDTVSIALDIPMQMREAFQYQAGQYLSFKVPGHAMERRSYSLCSSPLDDEWRVAVKQVSGGLFSSMANQVMKAGDVLEVMPPMGNFTLKGDVGEGRKHYVFFAAGSGITPVISIIKTALRQDNQCRCTLFYLNKTSSSIIFKEELEALKNRYLGRFSLNYMLSRERMDADLFQGRLDIEKCRQITGAFPELLEATAFYLCGPFEMIDSTRSGLEEKGVDRKKIHFELFTTPGAAPKVRAEQQAEPQFSGKSSKVSVNIDGVTVAFELGWDGPSVLEAATMQGADLPFSCKGGVCCTCKARLIEGEVEMDVNYALEEDEIEDGYILTCQAHPRSEEVLIDFDQ